MGCNTCTKTTKKTEFPLDDKGTGCGLIVSILNPEEKKAKSVKLDCCTITDGKNCDYLVEADYSPKKKLIYVELKGKSGEFSKALEQIKSTWSVTKDIYKGHKMKAFVVGSALPKNDATFTRLKKSFQRETGGMLVDRLNHRDKIDLSKI
jgi:hypothetical protein